MSGKHNTDNGHDTANTCSEDVLTTASETAQARRRLLRMAAYVPPAIVGMVILGRTGDASAAGNARGHHIGSCMPSACRPCIDYDDDESKDKNSYTQGNHRTNKARCNIEKEKKRIRDRKRKHRKKK